MKQPPKAEKFCVDCVHFVELPWADPACALNLRNPELECKRFEVKVAGSYGISDTVDSRDVQIVELKSALSAMADLLSETQDALEQKTARHSEAMRIIETQRELLQKLKD